MSTKTQTTNSVSFSGLLLLLFIALKLTGVIAWSWWWVLSPVWLPLALVALILVVWAAFYFISSKWKSHG